MNIYGKAISGIMILKAIVLNKFFKKRIPLIASIFLTNRCNLKCFYCYAKVFGRKIEDPTKQELFKIIDGLKELGTVMIVLLGGEPLLRKDIAEIIEYIVKNKIMCEVLTNGFMVEENIQTLKKVDSLCISIDGDKYHHELNRGNGSYEICINALKSAVKNGIPTRIHATITRNNIESLPALLDLSRRYGVKLNCTTASVHTDDEALRFNNEEIRNFFKTLKAYKQKGYPILNAMSSLDYLIKWPESFSYVTQMPNSSIKGIRLLPCKRKDFTCYIDVDGSLYPCATIWNTPVPNIKEAGLKQAWEAISSLKCQSCITEVEANMLFSGNLRSFMNIFTYVFLDNLRKIKLN